LKLHRAHRFSLRKKINEPKNISEYNIRLSQGYYRIWDCGNIKYKLNNDSLRGDYSVCLNH